MSAATLIPPSFIAPFGHDGNRVPHVPLPILSAQMSYEGPVSSLRPTGFASPWSSFQSWSLPRMLPDLHPLHAPAPLLTINGSMLPCVDMPVPNPPSGGLPYADMYAQRPVQTTVGHEWNNVSSVQAMSKSSNDLAQYGGATCATSKRRSVCSSLNRVTLCKAPKRVNTMERVRYRTQPLLPLPCTSSKLPMWGGGVVTERDDEEEGIGENQSARRCDWANCMHPLFSTIEAFVVHVQDHVTNERDFMCKWRGCARKKARKAFRQTYMLGLHVRRHTGEKPCKCTVPGGDKAYSRAENLKTHEKKHTGERPHVCEIEGCDKAFANASDRAKHQNRTHSTVKSFHCPVEVNPDELCTKSYTDPSSRRKHIVTSHSRKAFEIAKRMKAKNTNNGAYGIVRYRDWSGGAIVDEDVNYESDATSSSEEPPQDAYRARFIGATDGYEASDGQENHHYESVPSAFLLLSEDEEIDVINVL